MNLSWQQPLFYASKLPPAMKRWLLYRGSMTDRMLASCNKMRIEVLQHRYQRPTQWESQLLQLPSGKMASIREVIMICDDAPWLYARAVIPLSVLNGRARRFHYLGKTPLGRLLFRELHLKRSEFTIAQLSDKRFSETPLWARRSLFTGLSAPILLCEAFLPAMEKAILTGPYQ